MGTLVFAWPQITWVVLAALGVGLVLAKHGERRTGTYNVWWTLLGTVSVLPILYFGGFFTA